MIINVAPEGAKHFRKKKTKQAWLQRSQTFTFICPNDEVKFYLVVPQKVFFLFF